MTPTVVLRAAAVLAAALLPALAGAQAALSAAGRETADKLCAACHGADGNNAFAMFPRLAGTHAEYTAKQLYDYILGKRKSDVMVPLLAPMNAGERNPQMAALSAADVPALAAFYAAQKAQPGPAADPATAAAGRRLYENGNPASGVPGCVGCHGPAGAGDARYPRLASQHQQYMVETMAQFKSGARHNDRARVMRLIAERMTEPEIAAVSAYLQGQ